MESEKVVDEVIVQKLGDEKILKAKELYSNGSKNFLVKNYSDAADELSQVCEIFGNVYGEFSDELGMPYLLYAKSLIALALDENKIIDVPEEEAEDDDDEEEEEDDNEEGIDSNDRVEENLQKNLSSSLKNAKANGVSTDKNEKRLEDEVDSTEQKVKSLEQEPKTEFSNNQSGSEKVDAIVSSTENGSVLSSESNGINHNKDKRNSELTSANDEKPSTSNGENMESKSADDVEDDDNEAASNLQLAWEILETAAKIFTRQGMSGLPNLADVQTELGNIELENNIPEGAREDYEKALKIYKELVGNYRRAMAEIYYKIGLTFLMQQMNQEAANSLREACTLLESEIMEINSKENVAEKDKNIIQDMEETKQEILDKITEIEEIRDQNVAEVHEALKNFISHDEDKKSVKNTNGTGLSSTSTSKTSDNAGISSSTAVSSSTLKPNDISHLIKRKKPNSHLDSEAEALESPVKKRAV